MLIWLDIYFDLLDKLVFKEGRFRLKREILVFFDDYLKVVKRSEEILELFRIMDVKKLVKFILKDKKENIKFEDYSVEFFVEEMVMGEEKKVFVLGVNVYYFISKK